MARIKQHVVGVLLVWYSLNTLLISASPGRGASAGPGRTPSSWNRCGACALWLAASSAFAADDALRWFEHSRPTPLAQQAVEMLADAASHGLDPRDYDAGALWQGVTLAAHGAAPAPETIARLEPALSAALQRYLEHLHRGRVDPRRVHPGFAVASQDPFDAAAALRAAFASGRLLGAVQQAVPRVPLYETLRFALARYRALADSALGWHQPLPPLPGAVRGGGKLEPGQPYPGLELLAQRLAALGDLAPSALGVASTATYEGPLVDAVIAFQQRHGLAADGVIGKATLAQLEVTPSARVRQIELALERLRWTPLLHAPRMIVINIPEFVLRAYVVEAGRISVQREMKVIVGQAMRTQTPQLIEAMRYIEFSPYWNIPPSIVRGEVAPRLRREPLWFDKEGFEFIGRDGRVSSTEFSVRALDAVLAGELRLRQRPGARNPLGDIKFVFPNREHIYLHHTPSTRLFERERRDFSHGCIRVEQPVALATFVLHDMPDWTEQRIERAMHGGASSTLRLASPVPVLIAYGTALVKQGRVHFFADLYGHDRTLDTWLRNARAAHRTIH
jgi:L,D-transpeptidase YcbB